MKIAEVAPLFESVPPKKYGGTERVVSFLTEELVRRGHDVTLFASGESITSANLVECSPHALRNDTVSMEPVAWHMIQTERVAYLAEEFDIIHFHTDFLHFPVSSRLRTPHVTTLHGRLDLPELPMVFATYPDVPLISISDAQRTPLPNANWRTTVYHGLPDRYIQPNNGDGRHLLFLGRVAPEKGTDRAIQIAIKSERPLIIAAKIDRADREYFEQKIIPLLNHPLINFIGEVSDAEKCALFKDAIALLFPIDWPEPFGLVMIEAMASGVPVVAFPGGSVREIIEDGRTGFIVNNIPEAVAAVHSLYSISRSDCCRAVSERFSVERMAAAYLVEFERILNDETGTPADLQLREV